MVKFDNLYVGNAYREETDFVVRCSAEGVKIMYDSRAAQINLPPMIATGGSHVKSMLSYRKDIMVNTWRFLRKNYAFLKDKYHLSKSIYRMEWDCIRHEIIRVIKQKLKL